MLFLDTLARVRVCHGLLPLWFGRLVSNGGRGEVNTLPFAASTAAVAVSLIKLCCAASS